MPEISLFVDESGESGTESKYYLLTLVFHEQNSSIDKQIELYESALHDKRLPDIPLHTSPLLNGHDDCQGMDIQDRSAFCRHSSRCFSICPSCTTPSPTKRAISKATRRS